MLHFINLDLDSEQQNQVGIILVSQRHGKVMKLEQLIGRVIL